MNGIHDMGGMHGMGRVPQEPEATEPVFHEVWEGRVYAISRAIGPWQKWNSDTGRFYIEQIPPAEYLRMSYYEKWFTRLVTLLIKTGLVTREEVESGKRAPRMARKPDPPHPTANQWLHLRPKLPDLRVGECPGNSTDQTRIKQETPKSWTRRIPPARQPFITDTSVAAVMTAWLDWAGEIGHCCFIQPATEISRKRNGSRHFDIGSSLYRRRQGLSHAVSDRSSFRAIRDAGGSLSAQHDRL